MTQSRVHAVMTWPFFEAGRALGLPVDAGLEALGEAAGPEARLSHELANDLLAAGVELSGRADLGLLAAEVVEPGHFELVELASRSQGSVGEAIETLSSLAPILHDAVTLSLERGGDTSVVRVAFDAGITLHPAGWDFIAATLLIAGRRQTGRPQYTLGSVALPYPRPADIAHLERHFECPLSFDSAALELRFPSGALQWPLRRSDAHAGRVLRQAAAQLLPPQAQPRHSPRAAQIIRERLGHEEVTLALVARELHVSERTLRRRLQDEGESFRSLLDAVRHELALEALRDDLRSTDEVAAALGFSTTQAFHRAFRRWTGQTVQAFRPLRRGAEKP